MIQRSKAQIQEQIKKVAADYLREPSDRTLGYLQLLLNYFGMSQKPLNNSLAEYPITAMGQGRTDALEWLHGGK
jgi:hypothetical protein